MVDEEWHKRAAEIFLQALRKGNLDSIREYETRNQLLNVEKQIFLETHSVSSFENLPDELKIEWENKLTAFHKNFNREWEGRNIPPPSNGEAK